MHRPLNRLNIKARQSGWNLHWEPFGRIQSKPKGSFYLEIYPGFSCTLTHPSIFCFLSLTFFLRSEIMLLRFSIFSSWSAIFSRLSSYSFCFSNNLQINVTSHFHDKEVFRWSHSQDCWRPSLSGTQQFIRWILSIFLAVDLDIMCLTLKNMYFMVLVGEPTLLECCKKASHT